MITIRKLMTLKRMTRLRKIAVLLGNCDIALRAAREVDLEYLAAICSLLLADEELPDRLKRRLRGLSPGYAPEDLLRLCNGVRHDLLVYLGAEPADWDFLLPDEDRLDPRRRTVYPFTLYVEDVRSPFNVGSIMRCADAFGVSRILLSESTPPPTHPRAKRASMGCWEVVPWEVAGPERLELEENVFAMETGGTPLEEFDFPRHGTLVVGSEELGVSPELLAIAEKRRGRVSIPLLGVKASLNVAQALSIVLYRWSLSMVRSSRR